MARAVEVGRAVLSSSRQPRELWLNTLIIFSQTKYTVDLAQLSSHALKALLSSGQVWMGHGRGMRVEIALSVQGDPLPKPTFTVLRDQILQDPIWPQLKLRAHVSSESMLQDGIAHIDLDHDEDNFVDERRCHRILKDVPDSDTRPPEGTPTLQLHIVRFTMDILNSKQYPPLKRWSSSPSNPEVRQNSCESGKRNCHDTLLHEETEDAGSSAFAPSSAAQQTSRKRKRPESQAPLRTRSSPMLSPARETRAMDFHLFAAAPQDPDRQALTDELIVEIQAMIQGAIRLSIYGNSRALSGFKIKANSFETGLAGLAPAIWRPGYLAELSQRAHLISTICQSFIHIARVKSTSISLAGKLQRLANSLPEDRNNDQLGVVSASDRRSDTTSTSFADHLWPRIQRSLLARSAPTLRAPLLSASADHFNTTRFLGLTNGHQATDSEHLIPDYETTCILPNDSGDVLCSTSSLQKITRLRATESQEMADVSAQRSTLSNHDLLLSAGPLSTELECHTMDCEVSPHMIPKIPQRSQSHYLHGSFVTERYTSSLNMAECTVDIKSNSTEQAASMIADHTQLAHKDLLPDLGAEMEATAVEEGDVYLGTCRADADVSPGL
ncbi:hypothetical protein ACEQ8H_001522 [Pleosporales sp. CAS-2024a]